jgi:hypothetical protein
MGNRCLRDYPELTDLVNAILSFGDQAPNMATDPQDTSQLLGSSAMVISLFDKQEFNFLRLDDKSNVVCVRLGHLSVYIMSYKEDIQFKHMVT